MYSPPETADGEECYSLQRLILSSNRLTNIDELANAQPSAIAQLKHLSLTVNSLADWQDLDHLRSWCPVLESLSITGNPLVEGVLQFRRTRRSSAHHTHPDMICQIATRDSSQSRSFRASLSSTVPQYVLCFIRCSWLVLGLRLLKIGTKERVDCELFYLSYVAKHGSANEAARRQAHPRWQELCESA